MKSEDLQKLVTFAMPYGKYQGRVIADLPGYYLNWFAREGFPSGELGRLLALNAGDRSQWPEITARSSKKVTSGTEETQTENGHPTLIKEWQHENIHSCLGI